MDFPTLAEPTGWGEADERSPRPELRGFPLLPYEVQWFLKHEHFSDWCMSLVDFQSTKWLFLLNSAALWLHFREKICPISS